MTVCVFLGPTLEREVAESSLAATYRPPVSQGDVYRATLDQVQTIAIIDGYFDRVPAVWHKEILWALNMGIRVIGAASMGAIRAAELAPFGMEGVGRIFEAFRDGVLEDDDEVAIVHGLADDGYRSISRAMVNIRATLDRAAGEEVIPITTRDVLVARAKEAFYPLRSWPMVLGAGRDAGLPAAELRALAAWLPANEVDQKRVDALLLLNGLATVAEKPQKPRRIPFEHTTYWDELRLANAATSGEPPDLNTAVLEELRLDESLFLSMSQAALTRVLASDAAARAGFSAQGRALQRTADDFRRDRDLTKSVDASQWMTANDLTTTEFARVMEDEARLAWTWRTYSSVTRASLLDQLKVAGHYVRLSRRAREKRRWLNENLPLSLEGAGTDEAALYKWHFEENLARTVPVDLRAYAYRLGLSTVSELRTMLLRDWRYAHSSDE